MQQSKSIPVNAQSHPTSPSNLDLRAKRHQTTINTDQFGQNTESTPLKLAKKTTTQNNNKTNHSSLLTHPRKSKLGHHRSTTTVYTICYKCMHLNNN